MTLFALATGLLLQASAPLAADLGPLVDQALGAIRTRRFETLFDDLQPVRLELPNQPAAISVRGQVAAAALEALMRRTGDLDLRPVGAAVVAPGHGYLELARRYQVMGTAEPHQQRILISVRMESTRWRITEVWVAPSDPPTR